MGPLKSISAFQMSHVCVSNAPFLCFKYPMSAFQKFHFCVSNVPFLRFKRPIPAVHFPIPTRNACKWKEVAPFQMSNSCVSNVQFLRFKFWVFWMFKVFGVEVLSLCRWPPWPTTQAKLMATLYNKSRRASTATA